MQEFAYQEVYGDEGKREGEGEEERKVDCGDSLEILCMDQVSVIMSQLSVAPKPTYMWRLDLVKGLRPRLDCIALISFSCQVLDPELDLRTVKQEI